MSLSNRLKPTLLLDDTMKEVGNLPDNDKGSVDLITFSNGGNDANFRDIAKKCFALPTWPTLDRPGYGAVSRECVDLLDDLHLLTSDPPGAGHGSIVEREREKIIELLASFGSARLVLSGYPMLVSPRIRWPCRLRGRRSPPRPTTRARRSPAANMVDDLNGSGDVAGPVALYDILNLFAARNDVAYHGVGSTGSRIVDPARLPIVAEELPSQSDGMAADGKRNRGGRARVLESLPSAPTCDPRLRRHRVRRRFRRMVVLDPERRHVGCLTSRYSVLVSDASWDQVNSI